MNRPRRIHVGWAGVFLSAVTACGGGNDGDPAEPRRRVVTADWLNHSVSILDMDALIAGAEAEEALVAIVEVPEFGPGPLEIEVTPDGKTAVVSCSPGFYDSLGAALVGVSEVPVGGAALLVDLENPAYLGEAVVSQPPMGIAIHPDGTRAYLAGFGTRDTGGNTLAVISIPNGEVLEEMEVAGHPEQIALSDDGSRGAYSADGIGSVVTFDPSDPVNRRSEPLFVADDPSGLAFLRGSSTLVVANSFGPPSFGFVEAEDIAAPTILNLPGLQGGIPFGATALPGGDSALLTISGSAGVNARLAKVTLGADPVIVWDRPIPGSGFVLNAAVDPEGEYAFAASPADRKLSILRLPDGEARSVGWLEQPGPTYVAISILE